MENQEESNSIQLNNVQQNVIQTSRSVVPAQKTNQRELLQKQKERFILKQEITINPLQIEEHLHCSICCKLAVNASQCIEPRCGKMICSSCVKNILKKQKKCPFCRRSPFQTKDSSLRQQINILKSKCEFCKIVFKLVDEQLHYRKECSYFNSFQCKFCPDLITKDQMVDHTLKTHKDKLNNIIEMLYEGTQQFEEKQILANNKLYLEKIGKSPRLGSTSKFYCGKQLQTKCRCCNGYCGPTNGENCRDCMKLDIKRFGLKKGQFLNSDGKVCWKEGDAFCCGTLQKNYGNGHCNSEHPCNSCQRMKTNYVRYEGL